MQRTKKVIHWSFCKFCDKPVNLREQLHFSYNFIPNYVPTNEPWWCPHCFVTNDMYKVFNTKRKAKKAGRKRRKEHIKWELWQHSHYDIIYIPRELHLWWIVTEGKIKRRYRQCREIIRGLLN